MPGVGLELTKNASFLFSFSSTIFTAHPIFSMSLCIPL